MSSSSHYNNHQQQQRLRRQQPWQTNVDMFRKLPADLLTDGNRRSNLLSYAALALMATLFVMETKAYLFGTTLVSDLSLDKEEDNKKIRLNFNITMLDLRCDWAVIDVVSKLGTEQGVTAHVTKWNIDGDGVRKGYRGRNRNQKDIAHFDDAVTASLDDLHDNGEDAISLDATTLSLFKKEYDFLFVDFFAR